MNAHATHTSWRDSILNDFILGVSKLTLVADPDSLLTEEKLALELRRRGFDLIEFNDPIEFRYAYESKYRSLWDQCESTDLVVILRLQDNELESLPYDLLQAGRKLSFNLGDLFPNLSYPVIEKLDRSLLDAIYKAQNQSPPDSMGDNATKDFILRYVFGIAAELITNEVDLLRALLRMHYVKNQIPLLLLQRLIRVLKEQGSFQAWPLNEIIPDEEAFFAFLQERWPIFLNTKCGMRKDQSHSLHYSGPDLLSFDHQDIKVYIDNLFVEGKLVPIRATEIKVDADSWILSGIVADDMIEDEDRRISRLFDIVAQELPTGEARYSEWIAFALKLAELTSLIHCGNNAQHQTRIKEVGDALNTIFAEWLVDHYANLISLSPNYPAMLHHVPRRLARNVDGSGNHRVALIVVDGLALAQWVTIRPLLQRQDSNLVMRESATFAWIPTLTSVSRQAIFSGKPPLYFPSSIYSTSGEEKLWKQFWEGHGLSRLDVAYQRGLGDGEVSSILETTIHPGKTKVVGLVIDKVDKIMHGMQLGAAGMHNQIKQWCQDGFLGSLIGHLLNYGYEVWLTADHGNIECKGNGSPSEGVIAEIRSERVRIYPTRELRAHVAESFTATHQWLPVGLPADYFPLMAKGRNAFVKQGDTIISHGGIAIEEVIVPLVKFERR